MTAEQITTPTPWTEPAPETLYGIFDNYEETFTEAYELQREAELRATELNDLYFNSYDRYPRDEDRYTVDQLPQPYPEWAVRP